MKNILITGHPRSGTQHIAKVLNRMGYSCTYEKRNPDGFTASWKHIISGYFEPPCAEKIIECKFDKIIHQVRHPLKVISSSTTLWTMSMNFMARAIDLPDAIKNKENTILNCMTTWLKWNELIESKAVWRYRLEDLYCVQKEWCQQLEIPVQEIPKLPHTNTREHISLTWSDLYKIHSDLTTEIRDKAFQYGYAR